MSTPIENNTAALNALLEKANSLPEAGSGSADAVLYTPQELTAEQQAQARTNIGALAESELDEAIDDALAQAKESGDFKGDKGDKGDTGGTGPAGYTPVRGTDYWTAQDKTQIVSDVLTALPKWNGGSY